MFALTFPAPLARLAGRLPRTPPNLAFCFAANRLLWSTIRRQGAEFLTGRRFAIRVTDLGLTLGFAVSERGFAPAGGAPELTISASARDFMLLALRREDADTLFFSRRLVTEGDTELGLMVKNLLDALDQEEVLHSLPAPAAHLARLLLSGPRWRTPAGRTGYSSR